MVLPRMAQAIEVQTTMKPMAAIRLNIFDDSGIEGFHPRRKFSLSDSIHSVKYFVLQSAVLNFARKGQLSSCPSRWAADREPRFTTHQSRNSQRQAASETTEFSSRRGARKLPGGGLAIPAARLRGACGRRLLLSGGRGRWRGPGRDCGRRREECANQRGP